LDVQSLGLSGTVGGFAAGLILSDDSLRDTTKQMLVPLIAVFTPIFFLLVGMQVNLKVFLQWHTLLFTFALLLAAVLGKLAAALVAGPGIDRATVALGMLPRGEVALIFVGVGRTLGVIDDRLFAALVAVIVLLTFGSGVALKWAFGPRSARTEGMLARLSRWSFW
jgi:Kef-type K+ transport system membrane component KefB